MTTDKYDLHTMEYSVQGWDAILTSDMEKLDDMITSRMIKTIGETVSQYDAVYLKSDGKFWKAKADGTAQPALGLMIESAVADEEKRIQREGVITNSGWSWTTIGGYVYLSDSTFGGLTETAPSTNAQVMGFVLSSTSIFFNPVVIADHPFEVGGTWNDVLDDSMVLLRMPIYKSCIFPEDLINSNLYAEISASASAVISLKKNGTEFGTATFSPDTNPDAAAATDKTGGKVGIPVTAHGFSTGQKIILDGTTNYDGTYEVDADSTTDEIVIVATYAAETFTGTEDILLSWAFFTAASSTTFSENDIFTITAPASADSTLANLGWVIVGSRPAL